MPIPWWASLYAVGYVALVGYSLRVDVRNRRPAWEIVLDLVSGGLLLLLAVAHWQPEIVAPLGRATAPVFAAMVVWDIHSTGHDLNAIEPDPDLTPREDAVVTGLVIAAGATLMAPAYAFALSGIVRAWPTH